VDYLSHFLLMRISTHSTTMILKKRNKCVTHFVASMFIEMFQRCAMGKIKLEVFKILFPLQQSSPFTDSSKIHFTPLFVYHFFVDQLSFSK